MSVSDPCAQIWELADWLTVEQAAARWCGGDYRCREARAAAVASAAARGEIETRQAPDSPRFSFDTAEGLAKGWVQVSRTSLDLWAAALPDEVRPTTCPLDKSRRNVSHLLAIDALALAAAIDLGVRGGAARLAELTQRHGLEISPDSAERIANAVRASRAK